MAEMLTIMCDKCRARIGKARRVKLRFGREAGHAGPLDLCRDCAEDLLLKPLGLAAPGLPFGPDDADPEPESGATRHPLLERKARG